MTTGEMKRGLRFLRLVPVILVMGTIFLLSRQPGEELPLPPVPGIDKLAHALAYGVLAGTAIIVFLPETRRRRPLAVGIAVIAFCILYGLTDEFHQSFIPGRSPSPGDIIADTVGSMLTVGGWTGFSRSGNPVSPRQDFRS